MPISYRIAPAAGPDDIAAIGMLTRAYALSLSIDLGYQDFEGELAGLPGDYAGPTGALLLARAADGTPLGCGALRAFGTNGACEMKRLYVDRAARGLSLGRALVERLVEAARAIGYGTMLLDTLPEMAAAQALYRSAGFTEVEPYYDTPVEGTIFMALRL